jgi:hypothetical protein
MELKLDVLERHARQGGQFDDRLIPDLAAMHLRAVGIDLEEHSVKAPRISSAKVRSSPAASTSSATVNQVRPASASIHARVVATGLLKKSSSASTVRLSSSRSLTSFASK